MSELDDFYHNKEQTENDARALLDRRRVELWSKLIAEIIPEKVALLKTEKRNSVHWVDIGSETVVAWSMAMSGEDANICLFQDGRLGRVFYPPTHDRGSSYDRPGVISKWLGGNYPTDGLNFWELSNVTRGFFTIGPFVRETNLFQGCLGGNWDNPEIRESLMCRFHVA
jgi:hypothetical protein